MSENRNVTVPVGRLGWIRVVCCMRVIGGSAGPLSAFSQPEDVAVRVAEPGAARRADLRDVVRRPERTLVVVQEFDASGLEIADQSVEIADLKMPDGVIGLRGAAP